MGDSDSSDDAAWSREVERSARRVAYGTLRLPEADELVSSSAVVEAIKSAHGRYHILDLQHAELGDSKIERVFQELHTPSTTPDQSEGAAVASADLADGQVHHRGWFQALYTLSSTMKMPPRLVHHGIRIIELNNNDLTSDCLPPICNFLRGNTTLHGLSLRANNIDNSNGALLSLAEAVGQSALRYLSLSNNPISLESLAAFIDAFPASGTALERLQLSALHGASQDGSSMAGRQAALAADSIADFLADPQRCRSLYALSLNGNNFGSRGVLTIASAVIGNQNSQSPTEEALDRRINNESDPAPLAELERDPFFQAVLRSKSRRPNRCLAELDLNGNMDRSWLPVDPQRENGRLVAIKQRYASIPLEDVEAIVSFLLYLAREQRLQGRETVDREAPIEMTRHLATVGVTLDEWEADFQAAFEFGTGLNLTNWSTRLKAHLVLSFDNLGLACRTSAFSVFHAARTLGCRARRPTGKSMMTATSRATTESVGFFRFLDLPPELRLHVVRQLDEGQHLSARQFNHVISFACEPSTIGYGGSGYDWSQVFNSKDACIDGQDASSTATLPARRWSWAECFALRAPPRDWTADLLDTNGSGHRSRRLSNGVRRIEDGAAYAFLESTLTHRADP